MKNYNTDQVERFGILDTCVTFECGYTYDEFESMRGKGYTGVIFGYLDANWDGDFSRLDNYAHTSVFADMVDADYIGKNRAELRRRLELAKQAGLKVWMSVRGPLTGSDLAESSPEKEKKYAEYFGPGGDLWGGSGMRPMCLSIPEVRRRYDELIRDAAAGFPDIDGFIFFGGDSYSLVCDDTCPRCGRLPGWKNWSDWICELRRETEKVRPGVKFTVMNWPWWDDMFEMVDDMDNEIGVAAVSNWGFAYGGDGKRYPAATEPWECQDVQENTMRVPTDRAHKTVKELTQPWINAPVSEKFKLLAQKCRESGREFYAWCDLTTSEAVWPYFTPFPATTLKRLRSFAEQGADGVVDFWGIPAKTVHGERADANTELFGRFFEKPSAEPEELLRETAAALYGGWAVSDALRAWEHIDDALAEWPVVGYAQRMHWTVRRLWERESRLFYVFNLALPYTSADGEADSFWPEHLRRAETWERMKKHLAGVLASYDSALGCYDRICLCSEGTQHENAVFHRDSAALTRCYFQIAYESCEYHIAGLAGRKLSADFMRSAILTRRMCSKLYVSLGTVPYENDMSAVMSDMSDYIDRLERG